MQRLFRSPHATTLGTGLPTLFVFFPAFVAAFTMPFVFVSGLVAANWAHQMFNLALLAVLGAGYVVWRIGVFRGLLTSATGAGFVVAGYGLGQRVFCEFLLSMLGEPARSPMFGASFGSFIALIRISGLIGFAFGLAMVLAAGLRERRLARRTPAWVRPR